MATRLKIKQTAVSGKEPVASPSTDPAYIEQGELALNTTDKSLWTNDGSFIAGVSTGIVELTTRNIADSIDPGLIKIGFTQTGNDYPLVLDANNQAYVNVPWTDTNTDTLSGLTDTNTAGVINDSILKYDSSTSKWVIATDQSATYSTATSSTLGLVKIGFTQTGKDYPLVLDGSDKAYVNVPWTDTNTDTLSGLTDTDTTGVSHNAILKYDITTSKWVIGDDWNTHTLSDLTDTDTTGVSHNAILKYDITTSKWVIGDDWNTTYSTATSGTLGLVKIGFTQTGKDYPVVLSSEQMYVNVPWTDTDTVAGLTDTNTSGITNNSILKYDSVTSKWVIGTNATAGATASAILPAAQARLSHPGSGTGPGISWGSYNPINGEIQFTFNTAQPDSNYSVVTDSESYDHLQIETVNKTTAGFRIISADASGSYVSPSTFPFSLIVYSSDPLQTITSDSYTPGTNIAISAAGVISSTYSNFTGTTAGLVPTSTTSDDTKFLRADGTWVVPTDTDTLTPVGGSDTQVQYNNNGSFGGAASLTYNDSNGQVTCNTATGDSLVIGNSTTQTAGTSALIFSNKDATTFRPIVRLEGNHTDNGGNGEFTIKTYHSAVPYLGLKVDKNSDVYFYGYTAPGATPVGKFHWSAANEKLSIDGEIATTGQITTTKVTSNEFSSTATGVPTITSASNLILDPVGAVVIQNSPLRLSSFSTSGLPTGSSSGDLVYDSTLNKLAVWDGTSWVNTSTQVTVNNTLTSTSITEALSANQGKELKTLVDGKSATSHTHSQYAATSHSHSEYAATSHSHPQYASSSQVATSSTLGLVKIGFVESGKDYPVELSSGQMFVNVPWTGASGSSVDIQDTPPTSPSAGDLWINSTSMKLNVYYTDTNSSQWVETNSNGSNNYVDGASLGGSTLTLTRSGNLPNLTADLSSLSGDYVDSAVFNNTTRDLTIGRTGSLADLTVNIPAATNTSAINEVEYTATAGQTVFSMTYDSTEDTLTLYINGVKQVSSSYTAVTGTSNNVTLGTGANVGDEITIVVVSTLFVNEQIVGKSGNNGQASIPAGSTAQRTTGATGNLRFNTDDTNLEVYDSAAWRSVLQSGTNFEYEKIHPKSVTQTSTAIDMDNNNIYYLMSSNTSFQIQNHLNTGRTTILHLDRNTSGYAPTFPGVMRWAGGTEPTWTDHRDWIINLFATNLAGVFCSATGYNR